MFIKPSEGLRIVDPAMLSTPDDFLPAEGRDVQPSDYWTRRLRDGDVVPATPEAPAQTDAPT